MAHDSPDSACALPQSVSLNGWWHIAPLGRAGGATEGLHEIDVPSAWQSVYPDHAPDGGIDAAVYSREIPSGAGEGIREWICFESVATEAEVIVNGRSIGGHRSDWMPFQVEIPAAPGGPVRRLEVHVDRVRPGAVRFDRNVPVNGGDITKGFHDVLSVQHAGIWGDVSLRRTGPMAFRPNGVTVIGLPRGGGDAVGPDGTAVVEIRVEPDSGEGRAEVEIVGPAGHVIARGAAPIEPGARPGEEGAARIELACERIELWSPDNPVLYDARVRLTRDRAVSDETTRRFGFRRVEARGRRILLNGEPLFVSGILDWGHHKAHMAPSPREEEIERQFRELRARGFNLVCLCMWYPPERYYDIADRTGMLLWQEHPVWKSPMDEVLIPEYRRRFEQFFRRDRSHPSVIIVSGSCEHERFAGPLAEWWWARAKRELPDRLVQVQTAFLEWPSAERSDLDDEHTYESSGRWAAYLDDVDAFVAERAPKPFVLGESVLYVSWPRTKEMLERFDGGTPWWCPKGIEAIAELERELEEEFGAGTVARLRGTADRYHLNGRRFQTEVFRANPDHAGLVHNHIVDVPVVRCGLVDDFGEWRFAEAQMRSWLAPTMLLLKTPEWRRGIRGGAPLGIHLGVSHFGRGAARAEIELTLEGGGTSSRTRVELSANPGEVTWAGSELAIPEVKTASPCVLRARGEGWEPTEWRLWLLPPIDWRAESERLGLAAASGREMDDSERAPEFEERKYSSGWGLSRVTFAARPPVAQEICRGATVIRGDSTPPNSARVVVTHRITTALLPWVESGGRLIALAHKGRGSCPTAHVNMWGLTPFVPVGGAFGAIEAEAIEDLVDYDLTRRWIRSIPSMRLGFADQVDPVIRYFYTHDMTERVRIEEGVFAARLGKGVICISALDHFDDAGQFVLAMLVRWMTTVAPRRSLDPLIARHWATWEG